MKSQRLVGAGFVLAVVAASVSGCGSDKESPAAAKTAFIAQAEQLCSQLKSRLDVIFRGFVPTLPQRASRYRQVVVFGREFSKNAAALEVPKGDEDLFRGGLKDYNAGLDQLQQGVEAAEAGDRER